MLYSQSNWEKYCVSTNCNTECVLEKQILFFSQYTVRVRLHLYHDIVHILLLKSTGWNFFFFLFFIIFAVFYCRPEMCSRDENGVDQKEKKNCSLAHSEYIMKFSLYSRFKNKKIKTLFKYNDYLNNAHLLCIVHDIVLSWIHVVNIFIFFIFFL